MWFFIIAWRLLICICCHRSHICDLSFLNEHFLCVLCLDKQCHISMKMKIVDMCLLWQVTFFIHHSLMNTFYVCFVWTSMYKHKTHRKCSLRNDKIHMWLLWQQTHINNFHARLKNHKCGLCHNPFTNLKDTLTIFIMTWKVTNVTYSRIQNVSNSKQGLQ